MSRKGVTTYEPLSTTLHRMALVVISADGTMIIGAQGEDGEIYGDILTPAEADEYAKAVLQHSAAAAGGGTA